MNNISKKDLKRIDEILSIPDKELTKDFTQDDWNRLKRIEKRLFESIRNLRKVKEIN